MKLDPREHFDPEEIHGERVTHHDCARCYEARHVSEFTDPNDDTVVEALTAKHGGPVCDFCADEHTLCASCDAVTAFDDAWQDHEGAFFCPDCSHHLPDNARCAAADDARKAMIGG